MKRLLLPAYICIVLAAYAAACQIWVTFGIFAGISLILLVLDVTRNTTRR